MLVDPVTFLTVFVVGEGIWQRFENVVDTEPEQVIDTNWSDSDRDGQDDYPDSCLDFGAFFPHSCQPKGSYKVIVRAGDSLDTEATSDHRPVLVTLQLDASE